MTARPELSVLFREGMLLCPQHLQAFGRELRSRLVRGDSIGTPGSFASFGVLALDVDSEALGRDVFQVVKCEAILRDGTWVRFPELASLASRDFARFFTGPVLDVWLGVPAEQPGVPQIGSDAERSWRYKVLSRPVDDENEREVPRELDFREIQARLFFGDEDRSGFECLRVAQLVRRGRPVLKSELSADDVPPLLACAASPYLTKELRAVADAARAHARDLARRLPATAAFSSVDKAADVAGFTKLIAVNRAVAVLEQVAALPDLHPFEVYRSFADVVGGLAIFGDERVTPPLPAYDHEKLTNCFRSVFAELRSLIAASVSMPYDTIELKPDPVREGFFFAELPPEWLEGRSLLYLGVESAKTPEEVVEHIANCVKLVAAEDVDRFLTGVVPGIELTHERIPPVSFPKSADRHFFRIQTENASREQWVTVQKSRKLALLTFLSSIGTVRFHLYVELRR